MNVIVLRSALVALVLAIGGGALTASDRASSAAGPVLHDLRFIDAATGQSISAQLDLSAPDAGHWTFAATTGVYVGNAGAAMNVNSPTSVVINFEGPAVFRAINTTTPVMRHVKVHAQLDPAHHTAETTLWDGADQFHFVVKAPSTAGLDRTITAVEGAMTLNDATALYPLLNQQIAQAYDQTTFASLWQSQSATLGRVTALRRVSVGSLHVTDQGFWFVDVEYSADLVTSAGPATTSFSAFFIHEPSGWKLWTTTRH